MSPCDDLRPVLFRIAEGEAGPDEALEAAVHVRECTACRIVLAKDRRLVRILEGCPAEPVPVADGFASQVMARLPDGPPPGAERRRRALRRGFRIVGGTGAVGFAMALASKLHAPGAVEPVWSSWAGAIETGASRGLPAALAWIAKTLASALDRTGSAVRIDLPGLLPGWPGTDLAIAVSTAAAIVGVTAAVVAARAVLAARGD